MDAATLRGIMGNQLSLARYEQLLPAYEKMLSIIGATTIEQCAMVAGQIRLESGGLLHQRELWGPSAQQRTYDGRMGNRRGTDDWSKFRGHGWIQVTGRDNHTACSRWAHRRGIVPDADYFVRNPEALGTDEFCWVGPSWYFTEARPTFMSAAARGDVRACTIMINGGTTHLADRERFYRHALTFGRKLLPGKVTVMKNKIEYSRDQVRQDTGYNCGPASVQTIVQGATGKWISEATLGRELGTHTGGTDSIESFPSVLNRHIPGGKYVFRHVPGYMDAAGKDRLWKDIVKSIDAGHGVVVNIVAPPSNYPKAVAPSTISPAYTGGTVYHYIALMEYSDEDIRRVWVADSGFAPFGYWLSVDQLAGLIVPKGYAYSTAPARSSGPVDAAPPVVGVAPAPNPAPPVEHDDPSDEVIELLRQIGRRVEVIESQLMGPAVNDNPNGGRGWKVLGTNADGQYLTLVDGTGAIRMDVNGLTIAVTELLDRIEKLEGKK